MKPVKFIITGALSLTLAASGFAAGDSPISHRQAAMKDISEQMKILGGMTRIGGTYDDFLAIAAFETMQNDVRVAQESFPAGSDIGENTRAKPAIWADGSDFSARMQRFLEDVSAAVNAEAATQADFVPLFAAVSENCKSCHERYRAPKN